MKKHVALAILGFAGAFPVLAQGGVNAYERDSRYCASGRAGVGYSDCMRQFRRERHERDAYDEREYGGRQQTGAPRLSDMQQRALDNCVMLAPRDQPRCRATVMSTVR
jgi:hypothetical protein